MRKRSWLLMMAALFGITLIAAQAAKPSYDNLIVFGDSYCDVGNIFAATQGAEPPAPYFDGRFSNGPIWLDHVAGFLGVPFKASLLGGTDYAFGGAWVTAPQPIPGGTIPSVPEQVLAYLAANNGKADPHALYVLEGGGNDILGSTGNPNALAYEIAFKLTGSEEVLRKAGAKHFLIPNLFNVGLLPAAAGKRKFAAEASEATNTYVNILLELENKLDDIQILRMDVFDLLNAVKVDPTHLGFTNITVPCLSATLTVCSDPDHTFFWDAHHPTEFGHAFFAVTLENALTAQNK